MTTQRWTNATLRAYLGEHGFLQDGATNKGTFGVSVDTEVPAFITTFVRASDTLTLIEFEDGSQTEPFIMQNGNRVDVSNIGYRNEQLQHDKLRGD